MDALLDLLPALIILLVVVRALRAGARRAKQAPAPPRLPAAPGQAAPRATGGSPFEELVRRIEAAAAEAARQNAQSVRAQFPPPTPPALPRPTLGRPAEVGRPVWEPSATEVDEEASFHALDAAAPPSSDFHFVGGIDEPRPETEFHEAHAFVHADPPSAHMPSLDMPSAHLHDVRPGEARAGHPLVARLQAAGAAREAFTLKEVLSPPRSRRR